MADGTQLAFNFLSDRERSYAEVRGRLSAVIYANPDTGWKVIELEPGGKNKPVRLSGYLPNLAVGDNIQARCSLTQHPRFGQCLQVDEFIKQLPFSRAAVMKFLIAMIDGIGPHYAEAIVDKFGGETLQVLEEEPQRLHDIEGISEKVLEKIIASTKKINSTVKDLILEGFSPKWAGRIYLKYGADAAERVKRQPYKLIDDFKGIGFKKADIIARRVGLDQLAEERIKAGLIFAQRSTLKKTGHNYLYLADLTKAAARLLDLPKAYTEGAILAETGLVIEDDRVYLPEFYQAEHEVARLLAEKIAVPPEPVPDFAEHMDEIEEQIGISFSPEQRAAIRGAVENPVTVITGAAGTGKSTLCRGLLALLQAKGVSFAVCAPTGKAANKLASLTGVKVATIHRLFRYAPFCGFRVNAATPLAVDCLVVDEASMVDIFLFRALLRGITPATRLVFIGDPYQLPPVDSGDSLRALVASYSVNQMVLPRVFRQQQESIILRNAGMVNLEQPFPRENADDFEFIDVDDPVQMTWELYNAINKLREAGFHPIREINILTPLNKGGGEISVGSLNLRLRDKLNPAENTDVFFVYDQEYRLGDKVMQRKNDYELDVFNGDIGFIVKNDPDRQIVHIDFSGELREIPYPLMDNITLNYAMTVHKAQGSEARAVIFMATKAGCFFLLNKNLFYTAMTRAKEKLVMIMPYEVVESAVRFDLKRQSHLATRIQQLVIGREK